MVKKTNRITSTQIRSEIKSFTTNRNALLAQAHSIACMIVNFAAPEGAGDDCQGNGNVTTMAELMNELPKTWQVQLRAALTEFTPIRVSSDNESAGYDQKYLNLKKNFSGEELEAERLKRWNVAEFIAVPFYTLTKEPEAAKPMTWAMLKKLAEQAVTKIDKAIEDGRVPDNEIEAAIALKNRFSGIRTDDIAPKPPADTSAEEKAPAEETSE